jgi:hypothetical protein
MFTRLYFDTSELVAAGWPRLSADLENVLRLTTVAKIGVFLPAGVEIELQQRWQRDLEEKTSAMRSRIQAVEDHLGGVQHPSMSLDVPDLTKVRDHYLKVVDGLKQKYALSTVPFTTRPVREIFEMATTRQPPFKQGKEDVGFRDAVIFLSIVDELLAMKGQGHVGALVARDEAFHDPKITQFAARAGIELQVFRSVTAVFDSLMQDVQTYAKEKWEDSITQARYRLQSRRPEIEKFISERLDIPELGLVPGARVVAIPRIETLDVGDVRVPNPLEVRQLERVRLSFDVPTKFYARIEKFPSPPTQRRIKVGREEPIGLGDFSQVEQTYRASLNDLINEPTEEIEVVRIVRVEASADPKFETFSFESASLAGEVITPGSGALRFGA